MGKLLKIVTALAVVAFVGAWLGSPVLAVHQLLQAAEAGDAEALERKVDFPALRQSLKSEMAGRFDEELREKAGGLGAGLGSLGLALAPSLMDSAVDALVTPRVVAEVVRTGQRPEARDIAGRSADRGADRGETGGEAEAAGKDERLHRAYGYRDLNTFVIKLSRDDRPDQPLRLLMKRQGLFGWKLSGVEFPPRS
jgi:hypothetical protein